jgi:RNA polymerase sigma-70 factor, ECF subfamily
MATLASPTTALAEDELLQRARAGNAAALTQLLEEHQAQVYRFARRMCRNQADAEDIVQDTLLAFARNVHDFRGSSSLSTWLFSVARSFCVKKRRRRMGAPTKTNQLDDAGAFEGHTPEATGVGPELAAADKEVQLAVEAALETLEPSQREVLVLRDVEGLTAPEVAEVIGIGVTAVKSRLHRARLAARLALAPLLDRSPLDGDALPPRAPNTCPDVLRLFSKHLEGDIDAQLCAQMEAHLQSCPRCRRTCDSLKQTLLLCRSAASADNANTEVPLALQGRVRVALRDFLAQTA